MAPVRTCLLSRKKAPKKELLRFVQQAGGVVWDVRQNLPGRGVYVTPEAGKMAKKVAVKAGERALRISKDEVKSSDAGSKRIQSLDPIQIATELHRVAEMLGLNLK